jgi:FAD:protein FMN transferase
MVAAPRPRNGDMATASWRALGTTVVLRVAQEPALADARAIVEAELDAIDRACSRFRADSELQLVNASAGRWVTAGVLLLEALQAALRGAALTDGAVDPTLGEAIVLAGYSRDWAELEHPPQVPLLSATDRHEVASAAMGRSIVGLVGAPSWSRIEIGQDACSVRIPAGVRLDLGATAKALAADRAAIAVHTATGTAVLVSLGGDIATAGPSDAGGWSVHVTEDHRAGPDAPGQTIVIPGGGLATSSTTVRRWRQGSRAMHHILDPGTGQPVDPVWRTASVAAASCVDANIASTAALVKGGSALTWLSELRLPSRLVSVTGRVRVLAGWPDDPRSAER